MSLRVLPAAAVSVAFLAGTNLPSVRADFVVLKSGGEIRGEILPEPKKTRPAPTVTLRTLTGASVTVRREDVETLVRRRLVLEEYETRRRAVADTVEAQWELAEWCRSKSLSKQRAVHLERIIELDPEHVLARRGLGHTRHDGRWTTRDEVMTARGYVKHKGRWVLPQELELILEDERETEAERAGCFPATNARA